MPYRLNDLRAKMQFIVPNNFPSLVRQATEETGQPSMTRYMQLALCRQLAEDLNLDEAELIRSLPATVGKGAPLFGGERTSRRQHAARIGR